MDKQKLIAIAKDQLKGGIGEAQVRELLTYRGVEESDVEEIMKEVASESANIPDDAAGGDVVSKTDAALKQISIEPAVRPDYIKKEWKIVTISVIAFITVVIAGAVVYYLYF